MSRPRRNNRWPGVLVVFAVSAVLSSASWADQGAAASDNEAGLVGWVRQAGRAIGLAFRDIGSEGKRVGLSIGESAASFGKNFGKEAATAGKEVGRAAKEGGKALGRAITGKGSAAQQKSAS